MLETKDIPMLYNGQLILPSNKATWRCNKTLTKHRESKRSIKICGTNKGERSKCDRYIGDCKATSRSR